MGLTNDSFNRADSGSSLGSTDGSGSLDPIAWTQNSGIWGIISTSQAYTNNSSGVATVETSQADVTAKVTVAASGGSSTGLAFRFTDTTHYWRLANNGTNTQLFRFNGSIVQIGSNMTGAANGDILEVRLSGSTISVYRNGVFKTTTTDSFNSTATKHGMVTTSIGTAARLDDFYVGLAQTVALSDTVGITDTVTDHLLNQTINLDVNEVGIEDEVLVEGFLVPFDTWRPVLNPDRELVLVCRTPVGEHDTPTGFTHMVLWTLTPEGDEENPVVLDPVFGWVSFGHPEWAPDGQSVVIWVETGSDFQLVILDDTWSAGSPIYTATGSDWCKDPSYHPDGELVVFTEKVGSDYNIASVTIEGADYTVLYTSANELADPYYSSDGNFILFTEQTGPVTGPEPYGEWAIKYMEADGTHVTTVLDDGNANIHPCWTTPTQFAFQYWSYGATPSSEFDIALIDAAGRGRIELGAGEYPRTAVN